MPRRRGDGPGHTRARRRTQEAAVRGLVADAVAEAKEAHAAARCDLEGSATLVTPFAHHGAMSYVQPVFN